MKRCEKNHENFGRWLCGSAVYHCRHINTLKEKRFYYVPLNEIVTAHTREWNEEEKKVVLVHSMNHWLVGLAWFSVVLFVFRIIFCCFSFSFWMNNYFAALCVFFIFPFLIPSRSHDSIQTSFSFEHCSLRLLVFVSFHFLSFSLLIHSISVCVCTSEFCIFLVVSSSILTRSITFFRLLKSTHTETFKRTKQALKHRDINHQEHDRQFEGTSIDRQSSNKCATLNNSNVTDRSMIESKMEKQE